MKNKLFNNYETGEIIKISMFYFLGYYFATEINKFNPSEKAANKDDEYSHRDWIEHQFDQTRFIGDNYKDDFYLEFIESLSSPNYVDNVLNSMPGEIIFPEYLLSKFENSNTHELLEYARKIIVEDITHTLIMNFIIFGHDEISYKLDYFSYQLSLHMKKPAISLNWFNSVSPELILDLFNSEKYNNIPDKEVKKITDMRERYEVVVNGGIDVNGYDEDYLSELLAWDEECFSNSIEWRGVFNFIRSLDYPEIYDFAAETINWTFIAFLVFQFYNMIDHKMLDFELSNQVKLDEITNLLIESKPTWEDIKEDFYFYNFNPSDFYFPHETIWENYPYTNFNNQILISKIISSEFDCCKLMDYFRNHNEELIVNFTKKNLNDENSFSKFAKSIATGLVYCYLKNSGSKNLPLSEFEIALS